LHAEMVTEIIIVAAISIRCKLQVI